MDCSLPVSSSYGIAQARILEWVAISFSKILPVPGIEPVLLHGRQTHYSLRHFQCELQMIIGPSLSGMKITVATIRHRYQFSSVQALSRVRLFVTPWTTACQASLSITNSSSLPKLMSIESVMPSNHLFFCLPLLLLPSIFPSIRVFSDELALHIRWPKYWSFIFSISPSNEYSGLISLGFTGLISLLSKGLSRVLQHHNSKASILRCPAFFITFLLL